ncbi:hypothetical protein PFISCL1PPCAC_16171, partial [Pristionchus fissidentatus]
HDLPFRTMLKSFASLTLSARTASSATQAKPIISVPRIGSYNVFLKENAAKHTTPINKESLSAFSKETASKWRNLSDNEKQSYAARAQEINDKRMAAFMKKPVEQREKLEVEAHEAKAKLAKRRDRAERRENWEKTGHPKLPANAYMLFVKEKANQGGKLTSLPQANKRIKVLAEEWHSMSDSQKEKYTKPAAEAKATYKKDLEVWKNSAKTTEKSTTKMASSAKPAPKKTTA